MRRLLVVLLVALPILGVPVGARATPGTDDWIAVDAGGSHSCGIRDSGRLYCWGFDDHGQLGNDGDDADVLVPTEVAGGHTDWVGVSLGTTFTCGRRSPGTLWCWGDDGHGQLGNGATAGDQQVPSQVGTRTDWRAVKTGGTHACGRRAGGRLWCWGGDGDGQLGEGPGTGDQLSPVQVLGNWTNWTGFATGSSHTCGLRAGGRLYCWGQDTVGQLGEGTGAGDQQRPVEVTAGATTWVSVGTGHSHTCAIRSNGRAWCWGWNQYLQTGHVDTPPSASEQSPVAVQGGITNFTAVTGGYGGTCGRHATGRVWCWGQINGGPALPRQVVGNHADWAGIDLGNAHECGRRGHRLFCWGSNPHGELGIGTSGTLEDEPIEVDGG